ncbi:MAG: hypothetical protein M3Y72_19950 [Acidobacteriota bacterium]|nr:hypothetical protein [Acidobacteriota bacterium]
MRARSSDRPSRPELFGRTTRLCAVNVRVCSTATGRVLVGKLDVAPTDLIPLRRIGVAAFLKHESAGRGWGNGRFSGAFCRGKTG